MSGAAGKKGTAAKKGTRKATISKASKTTARIAQAGQPEGRRRGKTKRSSHELNDLAHDKLIEIKDDLANALGEKARVGHLGCAKLLLHLSEKSARLAQESQKRIPESQALKAWGRTGMVWRSERERCGVLFREPRAGGLRLA